MGMMHVTYSREVGQLINDLAEDHGCDYCTIIEMLTLSGLEVHAAAYRDKKLLKLLRRDFQQLARDNPQLIGTVRVSLEVPPF